jgi:uncharacterized protein (TIGR03435 family)
MASRTVFLKDWLYIFLKVWNRLGTQTCRNISREQYSLPHWFCTYYIEMRTLRNYALLLLIAQQFAAGQTPAPATGTALAFEVASIKPSQPITPAMVQSGKIHVGMKIDAARVDIGNFSLMQLICEAYKVKPYQVVGPDWMKNLVGSQRFDVVATMPAGATKEQVPQMLKALLIERFKLEAHEDTKEANVYALLVAKGGPKLKESAPPPPPTEEDAAKPASSGSNSVSIKTTTGGATISTGTGETQKMSVSPDGKTMHLDISNVTISKLADGLAPMLDRPLVDMTELKGRYDVALDLSMQEMMNVARAAGANVPPPAAGAASASGNPADAASDPGGGSIFTAIQSLGLRLEKRKTPLVSIVVDKVEKMPTEN